MVADPVRLPQFDEMIEWLRDRDIQALLWIAPWVMDGERSEAIERSFHVPVSRLYLPNAILIDFTNADAVEWWAERFRPFIETGIAGFELERGEEKPPDGQVFRGSHHDGTPYREGHNAYPSWFACAASGVGTRFSARYGLCTRSCTTNSSTTSTPSPTRRTSGERRSFAR